MERSHRVTLCAGVANAKLGNATASLPEYLAKKAHLSMHVELTSSIFQRVNERDLISLGRLEQELVFGEKKSNDIILHLQGWNARRYSMLSNAAMPPLYCLHSHLFGACNMLQWGVPVVGSELARCVGVVVVQVQQCANSGGHQAAATVLLRHAPRQARAGASGKVVECCTPLPVRHAQHLQRAVSGRGAAESKEG